MRSAFDMRYSLLLSLLVPGAGQIRCFRPLQGVALGLAYALCMSVAVFEGLTARPGPWTDGAFVLAVTGGGVAWLLAQAGMVMRLRQRSLRTVVRPARDRYFERGVKLYMRGDATRAAEEFRHALRLDPEDVDSCFYLAAMLEELGRHGAAAHMRRRCQAMDQDGKWTGVWLEREMRLRREGAKDPAAARSLASSR